MSRAIRSMVAWYLGVHGGMALADQLPVLPIGSQADYRVDSGEWTNSGGDAAALFAQEISLSGTAWLRLFFEDVQLSGASFIRVSSALDGQQQALDAAGATQWSNSTAYFNGDRVLLELVVAPGATGRVALKRVAFELKRSVGGADEEQRGEPGVCGICNQDDRVPTGQDWACRLMPVGCSASVYTSDSCLVSAGHCAQAGLVAQFRVPASLGDCTVVHPPVAEQFPVLGIDSQNADLGADWSVMSTGVNNLGQTAFQRYGQLRRIAPALAAAGDAVSIWGCGMDVTCTRNRTQQLSPGAVVGRGATFYSFNADVTTGNSGSGLLKDGRIIAVVTHCTFDCPNFGTRVDQANFVAGRNARCPACVADVDGDGSIDLADLAELLSGFGLAYPDPAFSPAIDLNADNVTNLADLALVLSAFGSGCP